MLIPCTQLPDLALGYMNDHDLGELWLNHPTLRLLRERRDISLTEFAECRSCAYHEVCTGNCPASAYTMAGDVNHPSPESCYRRFKAEGGRLPLDLLEECGVCTTQ
jgi:radical SAM protein with 4Fe4S-binding SPASM domain